MPSELLLLQQIKDTYTVYPSQQLSTASTSGKCTEMYGRVLALAGIELIFFIVVTMVFCIRFVLKAVLIIQEFFSYCWAVLTESMSFLLLTPSHQQVGWGYTISWEATQPGQLTPTDQRDIPCHMMSCSACKAERRKRKWGTFEVNAFVFPSNHYMWWSPAFLVMAEQLSADGKQWINSLFCFACMCGFALAIKLSLSQPLSFLIFTLLILSPIPLWGEWASGYVVLSCWVGLNQVRKSPEWDEKSPGYLTSALASHEMWCSTFPPLGGLDTQRVVLFFKNIYSCKEVSCCSWKTHLSNHLLPLVKQDLNIHGTKSVVNHKDVWLVQSSHASLKISKQQLMIYSMFNCLLFPPAEKALSFSSWSV